MTDKPQFTLGEDHFKVLVFDQYGDFDFDSFCILDPTESASKGWEVWCAEWHDSELKRGDLKHKLIEIHSEWVTKTQHVHLVCRSLAMGHHIGDYDGRTAMIACSDFVKSVFSGGAGFTELYEAAHQNGFGRPHNGKNFADKPDHEL